MRSLCCALLAVLFLSAPPSSVAADNAAAVKDLLTKTRLLAEGFSRMQAAPAGDDAYQPVRQHLAALKKAVKNPPPDFAAAMALAQITAQKPNGYKDLPDTLRRLADAGDRLFAGDGERSEGGNDPVAYANLSRTPHDIGSGANIGQDGRIINAAFTGRTAETVPSGGVVRGVNAAPVPPQTTPAPQPNATARHLDDPDAVPLVGVPTFDYITHPESTLTSWPTVAGQPMSMALHASLAPLSVRFGQDGVSYLSNMFVTKTMLGIPGVAAVMPYQTPTVEAIAPGKKDYFLVTPWMDFRDTPERHDVVAGAAASWNLSDQFAFGVKGQVNGRENKVSSSLTLPGISFNAGLRTNEFGDRTVSQGLSATVLDTRALKLNFTAGLSETKYKDPTTAKTNPAANFALEQQWENGVYSSLEYTRNPNPNFGFHGPKDDQRFMARIAAEGHPFDGLALAVGAVGQALFGSGS